MRETTEDILKEAILLEKRGRQFYLSVAAQVTEPEVRRVFESMAEEEERHIRALSYRLVIARNGEPAGAHAISPDEKPGTSAEILSREVLSRISAAGFEASAIAAAIALEDRAIRVYERRATEAAGAEERDLFRWLADWEKGHLALLEDMDRQLQDRVWNDNHFWPLD